MEWLICQWRLFIVFFLNSWEVLSRSTHHIHWHFQRYNSTVEFESPEDAQRAIRKLSEVPLLGRYSFVRQMMTFLCQLWLPDPRITRIEKTIHDSVRLLYREKSVWRWLGKAPSAAPLHGLLTTTTPARNKTQEIGSTLAMLV
ncbi:hypothetical protein JVU11DRAFT_10861 [Chiua virens]|nr:hypothetical protein JVU11DRAFT_10861 [Chiua virens]